MKENYEKAALGGAVAILLGVGAVSVFWGGDKLSSEPKSFKRSDEVNTQLLAETAAVLKSRSVAITVPPKPVSGREVDIFVGQPLYMREGSSKPVDPYESGNIHEGITNEWWRKYGIDPTFANAADRDFDKDGFTNREEHDAKTNPADKSSHPSVLQKLVGKGVGIFKMQMRWSEFDANSITLTYQDNAKVSFRERVALGAKFFVNEAKSVNQRFTLGALQRGVAGPKGRTQDAYEVIDNTPRYKGTKREKITLYRNGDKARGFNEVQDRSVQLTLNALGQEAETFTVSESESFSLPYDAKAKVRPYKVESIQLKEGSKDIYLVDVSFSSGEKQTVKQLVVKKQ